MFGAYCIRPDVLHSPNQKCIHFSYLSAPNQSTVPPIRQLSAIMFTDIEGYTGLMQDDEAQALQLLDKQKKKLEEVIKLHNGRILELRGDGSLCSFISTLECVRAAISLQQEMQSSPTVPLRIGIHIGDVMITGNTIYGDGVNIASRMESLAIAGSILISNRVFEDIKNQKDIYTQSLGKYLLKNVKEEIGLYAISNPGIKVPDPNTIEGKGERVKQKCILVLPFVNMSNDKDQEYFSDGLTEELISSLSRLKDMKVISRTTSMKYKNTTKSIKTISQEAEATYVMEGSVRTHGNTLRISAQLVDATRGLHLWVENYRGTLDDVFDIQEKVAAKIVDALRIHLTEDEKDTIHKRFTENTGAYQLYLQGRFFWNKRNQDGLKTAIRYFENALNRDPDYALAWVGLADTYSMLGEYENLSRRELHPRAKAAVNKALEIDSFLAEAHISLGCLLMINEWDWKNAEKEFQIGLELNPNYATGHHWYSEWLLYNGFQHEALKEITLAVDLDPVSQAIVRDQGMTYYYTRQYDKAINIARIAINLDPGMSTVHRLLSMCYQAKGMSEEAIAENQLWGDMIQNDVKTKVCLAQIYAASGRKDDARSLLIEINDDHSLWENDYRSMGQIYAALGEFDTAFEWLDKSLERRESSLSSVKVDPKMDVLRNDPRFEELVRRVGL